MIFNGTRITVIIIPIPTQSCKEWEIFFDELDATKTS